jgi:predicted dehydrogenase
MSIAGLKAGYHVLVEKPVTGASLVQVDDMIAARDAHHRHCAVGFQAIYSPIFQTLKQHIATGKLGQVKRIYGMALWPRNLTYYGRNNWAGKLFCDGQPVFDSPFNNAVAHQIMNLLFLASPEPGRAAYAKQVKAELFRTYEIESFDTGCLRAHTDSGVEVFFAASHACRKNVDPTIRLEAVKATAEYHYLRPKATITYQDGTTEVIEDSEAPRNDVFRNLADVLGGKAEKPCCTLEMARTHVACIDQIHRIAPIADVPAGLVSENEGGQRVIDGIERAIEQGFETGQLFSEIGASFAVA